MMAKLSGWDGVVHTRVGAAAGVETSTRTILWFSFSVAVTIVSAIAEVGVTARIAHATRMFLFNRVIIPLLFVLIRPYVRRSDTSTRAVDSHGCYSVPLTYIAYVAQQQVPS